MPRKTKAKKPIPAPRYRWEHDCPDAEDLFDQDFLTPEDALADCRQEILLHGAPGKYNIWIGEHTVVPADPSEANVAEEIDDLVELVVSELASDADNLQICGPHVKAIAGLKFLLGQWIAEYVEDHWPPLDRSTAQHHVVVVPAKTEAYPDVATALDQCLKGKLPLGVRSLLREARQKLPKTT